MWGKDGYLELNKIYNEDCLEGMERIPDKSVNMILTDLPYEMIESSWDKIIPLEKMWEQFKRVITEDGAIVLTASGTFATRLLMSNPEMFRYKWIWVKNTTGNFVNVRNRPLTSFEEVLVFSKSQAINGIENKMKYNPQGLRRVNKRARGTVGKSDTYYGRRKGDKDVYVQEYTNYPRDVLHFPVVRKGIHISQKPVSLFSYLIRTYTDKGEVVLDATIGSGTTAVSCIQTERNYIGFELDEGFYKKALDRIEEFRRKPRSLWE